MAKIDDEARPQLDGVLVVGLATCAGGLAFASPAAAGVATAVVLVALARRGATVVALLGALAFLVGAMTRFVPELRTYGARQIDDWDAIIRLGPRLEQYATIQTPTLLLGGDRSPSHLGKRLGMLATAMSNASLQLLLGQGHAANDQAPEIVAEYISAFAATVGLTARSG